MNKKKLRLFKNDPFGIKYKLFCIRTDWLMKKGIRVRTKSIATYLYVINAIGIPKDDEQTELLKKAVNGYDKMVQEIENILRYARMYIEEDEN